ncbi:MFS transporter [Agrobacterium vitis]|uniref:MFS transporter n=2 Tax=Agrobacterium vitis TaxID=373 RepID=A0AAE4WBL0_AGRVI|nr:MFS transporter [Allorhizobium sp. Av2]MCM2439427.1 MFS transporter [Agrobacterium vitis]MUZ57672.1 MFS transporter [Agrobacterium vitis]
MKTNHDTRSEHRSAALVRLLSIGAGAAVANSYYNQAFLGHLTADFGLVAGAAAVVPVLTQAGNALGVLFLAPLGDRLERKSLILVTLVALVVALIGAALSPGFLWLATASFAVGLFATVAQQLVPLAVHLAPPAERGRILGKVTGGILIGILLARTVSGTISDLWGWPFVFWFAAALTIAIGTALALWLPRVQPTTDLSYPRLIGSLWTLVRTHSFLRQAVAVQFLIFAAFIGFWSNLSLLLIEPPYQLGGTAVGLLALVGVAGALVAPIAGGLADRRGPAVVVSIGAALVVIAFAIFGFCQGSLVSLIIGILVMDLAVQSSQVANQARVYALDPTARSRLNTVFMATMLLGGAVGAGLGGAAYAEWGWTGTCAFGALSAGLALVLSRKS